MRLSIRPAGLLLLIVLTSSPAWAGEQLKSDFASWQSAAHATENQELDALFDIIWDWQLRESPEFATHVGHDQGQDRWSDESLEAHRRRQALTRKAAEMLRRVDSGKLDDSHQLSYALISKRFAVEIEGFRFPDEYLPLNQMGGVQQEPARILSAMRANKAGDYENILARLRALPERIAQTIARMEQGLAKGITPPKVTLRDVPQQVLNLISGEPADSPLLAKFKKMPDAIPAADRERLRDQAQAVVRDKVNPAYRKLHDFLVERYIPGARESVALSELPDGKDWYAYRARRMTTTSMTPLRIHEKGLAEVKRIRGEMQRVIRESGFKGDFQAFNEFLRTDKRFYYEKPEQLLGGYRDICKRADAELVKLFGYLPRLPYGVIKVPAYAEKSQTTAYYQSGSMKAGRPGYFFANTYDLSSRPKWEMEALSLHEAVPGHHLQLAIAQELKGLHKLRKYTGYTAFIEGWGLYSESLGEEMGFYTDPYSKFGQLTYEMWRAIRLVVDTGMHALGWSRQQAIDFFKANAPKTEHDIIVEVDRYIVWPGQALAYKIGELKIKELRARARERLGDKFDIRGFHDTVLGAGALPLDLLERRVESWIEARRG